MKTWLLLCFAFFAYQPIWANDDGGMDAGGGNSNAQTLMSVAEINEITKVAPAILELFFNDLDYRTLAGTKWQFEPDAWRLLYKNNLNFRSILKNFKIRVENNSPCYDSSGNATDASIYSSEKNAICLSAYRLSQKLFKGGAEVKIFALLLHEYSHLLGTNEIEARQLQGEFEFNFENQYIFSLSATKAWLNSGLFSVRTLIQTLPQLETSLWPNNALMSREILRGIQINLSSIASAPRGLSILNSPDHYKFHSAEYQLIVTAGFLQCKLNDEISCNELARIFKGKKVLTTDEFILNWLKGPPNVPGNTNLIELPEDEYRAQTIIKNLLPQFKTIQAEFENTLTNF